MLKSKDIIDIFPFEEEELIKDIFKESSFTSLDENTQLIKEGEYIKSFPLIVSGCIKVSRLDLDGDELLLYYLNKGEVCTMALTCCTTNIKSNIQAIAIEDSKILKIPVKFIDEWMYKYPSWKKFIMSSYRFKFEELLNTIDSIAFMKMDQRLVLYFKNLYRSTHKKEFIGSHKQIAYDLNTSREVVSRLLKKLEKNQKIVISRNKIDFSSLL